MEPGIIFYTGTHQDIGVVKSFTIIHSKAKGKTKFQVNLSHMGDFNGYHDALKWQVQ